MHLRYFPAQQLPTNKKPIYPLPHSFVAKLLVDEILAEWLESV